MSDKWRVIRGSMDGGVLKVGRRCLGQAIGTLAWGERQWLVLCLAARNLWISPYRGVGAFSSGALPDVYKLEKRALH
jgi:hypothetical protein